MKHLRRYSSFIVENKFYQSDLNPKFWKKDEFDPAIREKLLKIAKDFYKDLDITIPVDDVQLTGSLANYNWNKHSDLDVHLIMDLSKINQDVALVKKGLDGVRAVWNQRHPVVIKGHDVELYAQDINQLHMASGLYSLLKGEWIRKPEYDPPTIDPKDVSRKVEAYGNEIDSLKKRLKSASPEEAQVIMDYAGALKKKLSRARDEKLVYKGGEFSIENLVFKEMRNNGMFGDLINIRSEAYGKIYSE